MDAGLAGIHYDTNMDLLIVVFYSLSNAFDLISGRNFRENMFPNIFFVLVSFDTITKHAEQCLNNL